MVKFFSFAVQWLIQEWMCLPHDRLNASVIKGWQRVGKDELSVHQWYLPPIFAWIPTLTPTECLSPCSIISHTCRLQPSAQCWLRGEIVSQFWKTFLTSYPTLGLFLQSHTLSIYSLITCGCFPLWYCQSLVFPLLFARKSFLVPKRFIRT